MTWPRLLLVEDDASIRRFVAMALEDEAVDVVPAASLAQARQVLRDGPVALLMCDLMLPDGSGLELLRELTHPAACAARMARVAFSAGVSPAVHQQLLQAGVLQVLSKPVALVDLLACTRRALSWAAAPGSPSAGLPVALPAPLSVSPPVAPVAPVLADGNRTPAVAPGPGESLGLAAPPQGPSAAEVAAAVAHFFGGDFKLYVDFDSRCRQQFGADLSQGERALRNADMATLRRLSHSLKSVLLSLGHGGASALAAQLEASAEREQLGEVQGLWKRLAGWLRVQASA